MTGYIIAPDDPESAEAQTLLHELATVLTSITGSSGVASFAITDVHGPRSVFVIARDAQGQPFGCGALRPLAQDIAEVKRMYARPGTTGIGAALLAFLEDQARHFGYTKLWLETRRINERAVRFYLRHGYNVIPNYGKYSGNPEAICFGKSIIG